AGRERRTRRCNRRHRLSRHAPSADPAGLFAKPLDPLNFFGSVAPRISAGRLARTGLPRPLPLFLSKSLSSGHAPKPLRVRCGRGTTALHKAPDLLPDLEPVVPGPNRDRRTEGNPDIDPP